MFHDQKHVVFERRMGGKLLQWFTQCGEKLRIREVLIPVLEVRNWEGNVSCGFSAFKLNAASLSFPMANKLHFKVTSLLNFIKAHSA